MPEVLKATATNKTFSIHLWRKGQEIQFSIDGINMDDQQAAVEQGGGKPGDQNVQQQQADMHRQLQNMFKGMVLGHSSPKSFLGAVPSSNDKSASIADSLKTIPSQMA